jgi:hypothetical protein
MNERIRELVKQAGDYVNEVYTPPVRSKTPGKIWEDGHIDWNEQFNEKFAELIVAECLKKVEEEYKPVLEDKEMMKDTHWDGYVQCGVDSYVAIREHFFGVEESKREKIDRAMREAFKDGVDLSGKETP